MSKDHGRKILNYSIKRKLQLRILLKVLTIVAFGTGLMAVIFYSYSNRVINENYRQFHIHAQNFLDYLLPVVSISLLLSLVTAVILTIFLPRGIAGPLYRIERDLKEKVCNGDLTVKFTIRKGDELEELAASANLLVDNFRHKIEKIKKSAETLQIITTNKGVKQDQNLGDIVKEMNNSLQEFRIQ